MVCSLSWAKLGQEGRKNRALPGFFFCWRKASRSARRRGTQEALGVRTLLLESGRRHACLRADFYIEHAFYIVYMGITKQRRMRLPAIPCFCYPRCEHRGGMSSSPIIRCGFTICFSGYFSGIFRFVMTRVLGGCAKACLKIVRQRRIV